MNHEMRIAALDELIEDEGITGARTLLNERINMTQKFLCPNCSSAKLRVVIDQTAVYDPTNSPHLTFVQDEEVNRLGGIRCDDCDASVEESDEVWEAIEQALVESI